MIRHSVALISALLCVGLLSACGKDSPGRTGVSSADLESLPSKEDVARSSQETSEKEDALIALGLKFKIDRSLRNGELTTTARWDKEHLEATLRANPGISESQWIEALERFIEAAEDLRKKGSRFRDGDRILRLIALDEIELKIRLSRQTLEKIRGTQGSAAVESLAE